MAEQILSQVPLNTQNPYTPDALKGFNEQYGVSDMEQKVKKGNKRLRKNIVGSIGFNKKFDQFLQNRKPVEQEISKAATAYSDIENPFVRRQLVSSAEDAIRGRRANIASDFNDILQTRLQAQQMLQQQRENKLNRAISDRDTARSFAANQYLNDVNFIRQKESQAAQDERQLELQARQFKQQMDLEKQYGVGNYAPRSSGGGGANYQFKELSDGTLIMFDPNSGSVVPVGQTQQEMKVGAIPTYDQYLQQNYGNQSVDRKNPSLIAEYQQYLQNADIERIKAGAQVRQDVSSQDDNNGGIKVYPDGSFEIK